MHRPLFLANHVQLKLKGALSPLIQMPVTTSPPLPQLLHGHPEFTPPSSLHMSSAAAPAASMSRGEFFSPVLGTNCQNLCSDKSFIYQAQCFPWIINHRLWIFGLIVSRALNIMIARKHLFPLKCPCAVNSQPLTINIYCFLSRKITRVFGTELWFGLLGWFSLLSNVFRLV